MADDILTHARETIKDLMRQKNVGVSELARRMGRSKSQVSVLLSRKSDIHLTTLDAVFVALGFTMGFALNDTIDDENDPALD